jgi:hypothetical protein
LIRIEIGKPLLIKGGYSYLERRFFARTIFDGGYWDKNLQLREESINQRREKWLREPC